MSLGATQANSERHVQQPFTGAESASRLVSHPADGEQIVSHTDFTECVDRCVSLLLATPLDALPANEPVHAKLRAWLQSDQYSLGDGTPIDFALFDSAILSIEERLPATGAQAQSRLLRAARVLAEAVYAKVATTAPRIAVET